MKSMIRPDESSAATIDRRVPFRCRLGDLRLRGVWGEARNDRFLDAHKSPSTRASPRRRGWRTPMVDISIVDLHEEPTADPRMEKVVGTIVNQGDRPVSKISIRIDLLDDAGNRVNSVTTPPLAQTIAALGGRATFEASVPRNPAVTTYHAVAIAQ